MTHSLIRNVISVWETWKLKLEYGHDSSQSQSSTGDLGDFNTGIEGRSGVGVCQGGEPDTCEF